MILTTGEAKAVAKAADTCGLSWLTLASLFVVWFVFTFVVVLCALLIFGGST